ncbi:hypothetical protein EV702DRAFT_1193624 [Suillus placidus]|uniref:Uncharacterized protein n=1 Tax=Suillus placidus TaxID=48579 RepID=A0A9P7A1T5_9AGAM|nr:hypothetical protein EV702DRAFT_1193624 [Suillus placidus]
MSFFGTIAHNDSRLKHLQTVLTHLPDCIPLGNSKYHFENFAPDPEKVELYGSTEAALNNVLEVTFAPRGRMDESVNATTSRRVRVTSGHTSTFNTILFHRVPRHLYTGKWRLLLAGKGLHPTDTTIASLGLLAMSLGIRENSIGHPEDFDTSRDNLAHAMYPAFSTMSRNSVDLFEMPESNAYSHEYLSKYILFCAFQAQGHAPGREESKEGSVKRWRTEPDATATLEAT